MDLPEETVEDLVYAVSEAATNAAEHAYDPRRAGDRIDVGLRVDDPRLLIEVSDRGRWRPPDAATAGADVLRGRGIVVMQGLVDTVHIDGGPMGTRVSLVHRLPDAAGR